MVAPTVSVIVTTYNRPDVLRLAIASALVQSYDDFELLVVGDACSETTGEAVRSFDDPRIAYHNLEVNHGNQAEPSNAGFELARGRFIAYLNHDDLWWPDHLQQAVAALEGSDADGVFTLLDSVRPGGEGRLYGVSAGAEYHPLGIVPASSWLLRRELLQELGGWRSARRLYNIPSQDLLFRAHKAGKRLRSVPVLTVLACHSGFRRNVYREPDREVAAWWERLRRDPDGLRAERLTVLARSATVESDHATVVGATRRLARLAIQRAALRVGVHWLAMAKFVRHLRPGGFLRALQRRRGLPGRLGEGRGRVPPASR